MYLYKTTALDIEQQIAWNYYPERRKPNEMSFNNRHGF